jgi:tellurite methyltransferase
LDSQNKWNRKYKERLDSFDVPEANARLKNLSQYLNGGTALDIACGLGANSVFLAEIGYHVEALDLSDVAINYVNELSKLHQLSVSPCLCDLTDWRNLNVNDNSVDLVVITYYLDRSIFPFVKASIRENGYFFMETFYLSPQTEQQNVSDQYKLRPKELLTEFGDWQVLYYEENEKEGRQTIFARKTKSL